MQIVPFIVAVLFIIVSIPLWRMFASAPRNSWKEPVGFLPAFILDGAALILVMFFSIFTPVEYYQSLGEVQELKAFTQSQPAYADAIEAAQNVILRGSQPGIIDVAYLEQAKAYTGLVQEYRDKVAAYNEGLAKCRAKKNVPFFGAYRVGVGDLQPINTGLGLPVIP